ncbi:ricin B lectin domain-containing protein [Mycena leptocephala]|nr:ricin B lectin domain-containing protein [Mycena leptocephala]
MSIYLVFAFLIASGVWGHPAPVRSFNVGTPCSSSSPIPNQNIHLAEDFEMCLTAASDANGAAVVIEHCGTGGSGLQNWTISGSTLQVLDKGRDREWDTTADLGVHRGNANQQWTLTGSTSIQWSEESSCLDLTNGDVTSGNVMQIWACTKGPNQSWALTTGVLETTIKTIISDTVCVTAPTNANGGEVVTEPCDGSASQLWTASGFGLVIYGDMCLDVPNGNTAIGTKLQIWACTPGDANQQLFFDLEHGSIQWGNKEMCVDLTNGSLANGNQLQMVTCNQETDDYTQVWQYGQW